MVLLRLSDDFSWIFIVPQSDEFGMTEVIGTRPFEKVDPDNGLRS
jgi:hypothetical protein